MPPVPRLFCALFVGLLTSLALAGQAAAQAFPFGEVFTLTDHRGGDCRYEAAATGSAYDPVLDQYLVVWRGTTELYDFSDCDSYGRSQIFARTFSPDGSPVGPVLQVSTRAERGVEAEVAYNSRSADFVVTWRETNADRQGRVLVRRIQGGGRSMAPQMVVAEPDPGDGYSFSDPRIVYDSYLNGYLVAFAHAPQKVRDPDRRLRSLHVRQLNFAGRPTGPATRIAAGRLAGLVATTGGEQALMYYRDSGSTSELRLQRILDGRNRGRPTVLGVRGTPSIVFNPDANEYLLVGERLIAGWRTQRSLVAQRLNRRGASLGAPSVIAPIVPALKGKPPPRAGFASARSGVARYNRESDTYLVNFRGDSWDGLRRTGGVWVQAVGADGERLGRSARIDEGDWRPGGEVRSGHLVHRTGTNEFLALFLVKGAGSRLHADWDIEVLARRVLANDPLSPEAREGLNPRRPPGFPGTEPLFPRPFPGF